MALGGRKRGCTRSCEVHERFSIQDGAQQPRSSAGRWVPGGGAAPLSLSEEMLSKKQEYLESRIERELSLARQHGTKNKRGEPRIWPEEPRVNLSVVT